MCSTPECEPSGSDCSDRSATTSQAVKQTTGGPPPSATAAPRKGRRAPAPPRGSSEAAIPEESPAAIKQNGVHVNGSCSEERVPTSNGDVNSAKETSASEQHSVTETRIEDESIQRVEKFVDSDSIRTNQTPSPTESRGIDPSPPSSSPKSNANHIRDSSSLTSSKSSSLETTDTVREVASKLSSPTHSQEDADESPSSSPELPKVIDSGIEIAEVSSRKSDPTSSDSSPVALTTSKEPSSPVAEPVASQPVVEPAVSSHNSVTSSAAASSGKLNKSLYSFLISEFRDENEVDEFLLNLENIYVDRREIMV